MPNPASVSLIMAIVLYVLLLVIGVWDAWVYWHDMPSATVTAVIQAWARDLPLLVLAAGIVLGHLFFPSRYTPPPGPNP